MQSEFEHHSKVYGQIQTHFLGTERVYQERAIQNEGYHRLPHQRSGGRVPHELQALLLKGWQGGLVGWLRKMEMMRW